LTCGRSADLRCYRVVIPCFDLKIARGKRATAKTSAASFRDELLNGEIFYRLNEARITIERWRKHCNQQRPNSALGYQPPALVTFDTTQPLELETAMQ
jgi:hypothetical protein